MNQTTEIDKFNAIAEEWWLEDGKFKPLHSINPLRLQFIKNLTNLAGLRVLDIGCGGGIFSEALAKEDAKVTGIDLAERSIDVAKKHAAEMQLAIDYQVVSLDDFYRQTTERFDVIVCMELLEHVDHPQAMIDTAAKLLKDGGMIVFSTINRNLKSFLNAIIGAEYILKILPKGTHHYAHFIKPGELIKASRSAGLTPIASAGIDYNPILERFSLGEDLSVNYLLACRK